MRRGDLSFIKISLFVLFFSQIHFSQSISWEQMNGPYGGVLYSIAFSPNGNLFAATFSELFFSTDKGETWTKTNFVSKSNIYKILVNSEGHVFVADKGYIFKSIDNGITWSSTKLIDRGVFDISFNQQNEVFLAVGNEIYFSNSKGETWQRTSSIPVNKINKLSTTFDGHYFAATNVGIFHSTDKGYSWTITNDLPKVSYASVYVTANGKVLGGTSQVLYSSGDFGNNWNISYLGSTNLDFGIINSDSIKNVWVSTGYNLLKSTNEGITWKKLDLLKPIYSLIPFSDGKLYACGLNGILISSDEGNKWTNFTNGIKGTRVNSIITCKDGNIFVETGSDIFSSLNKGESWLPTNATPLLHVNNQADFKKDKNENLFHGDVGGIGISRDKGITWKKKVFSNETGFIRSISFSPEGYVYALSPTKIYFSTNNGENWDIKNTWNTEDWFGKLEVSKNGELFVLRNGEIFKSNDNGSNWIKILSGKFDNIFITRNGYLILTDPTNIFSSKNRGENWIIYPQGNYDYTRKIFELPDGNVYMFRSSELLVSKDEGRSWNLVATLESGFGKSVTCLNLDKDGYFFAGTESRGVLKSNLPFLKILPPSLFGDTNDNSISLRWTKNASIKFKEYRIYVRTDTYSSANIDNILSSINDTTTTLDGLTYFVPYYIVVSASDNEGNESFSDEIILTPTPSASVPVKLDISSDSSNVTVNPTFCWKKSTVTVGYHLQISTDSLFNLIVINDSTITDTSIVITGLLNSTKYYWRVKALGEYRNSEWSDVWSFTTIIAVPEIPIAITPVNNSINISVNQTLSWNSSLRAEQYHIQLSKDSLLINMMIDSITTATTINVALERDTKYYWRMRAKNIGGESPWSAIMKFTTIVAAPVIPQLQLPLNNAINISADGDLKWKQTIRAEKYTIQVSLDSLFYDIIAEDTTIADTLFKAGPLVYETKYFWRVKAKNIGGESEWSNIWGFTTVIAPPFTPVLAEPANKDINLPIAQVLKWQKINRTDRYHLQISTSTEFTACVVNDSTVTDTLKQAALNNNTRYFWRVRAANIGGNSSWSETWEFKTIVALPSIPLLATPANGSKNQQVEIKLSWNPAQNAETYRLRLAQDTSFVNGIDDSTLTTPSKNISGLKTGMKYYWKVNAKNIAGISCYSPVWNFTTIMYAPDSVSAVETQSNKVQLTWRDNTQNELGFILERKSADEAGYRIIDTLETNQITYTENSVSIKKTYSYRIKSFTQFAVSVYSNEAGVTVTEVNGKDKIPLNFSLEQNYPNPFNPGTVIKYSLAEDVQVIIKIYDLLGSEVATLVNEQKPAGEYQVEFNGANLPSGVYLYRMNAGKFTETKKLTLVK